MSFAPFTPVQKETDTKAPVKAGLRKRRGSSAAARLAITIKSLQVEEWGWKEGDILALLMGRDESHGLIRMKPDPSGSLKLVSRTLKNSTFFDLNLGAVAEFVDRAEEPKGINAEFLDDGWVEFVLPDWADETGPKANARQEKTRKTEILLAQQKQAADEIKTRKTERGIKEEAVERKRQKAEVKDEITAPVFSEVLCLTKNEKRLLEALIEFAGAKRSEESIYGHIYFDNIDGGPSSKIVDVLVCKVRKKIEGTGCKIETVWGEGYKLIGSPEKLFEKQAA